MEYNTKQIILDYFEYKELKHRANIFNRLKELANEKEGSYEVICKSTLYHDYELSFMSKGVKQIKEEYKKQIEESSEYIERLKNKIEELENRNLIQRILNR